MSERHETLRSIRWTKWLTTAARWLESWPWPMFTTYLIGTLVGGGGYLVYNKHFFLAALLVVSLIFVLLIKARVHERGHALRQANITCKEAQTVIDSRIRSLLREIRGDSGDQTVFDLSNTIIRQYLHLFSPLHDASESNTPLLPGNFRVYAKCVQEAMPLIEELIKNKEISSAKVYTYFARTVFEWYNPFVKIVPDGTGRPHAVPYTEPWWEAYKQNMSRYKDTVANKDILLVRLMAHPRRFTTIEREKEIDFAAMTERQFNERYWICAPKVTEPAIAVPPAEVGRQCAALAGCTPAASIKPDGRLYTGEFRRTARVHCILEQADGAHHWNTQWHPLLEHFTNAHHTFPYSKTIPARSGCYVAYSRTGVFPWGPFADVFVVSLERHHNKITDHVYFGLALQTDGFNDAEGLKFMETKEITEFIHNFEKELSNSSDEFCVVEH